MKYLKTFETVILGKYNIDDYVLLANLEDWNVYPVVKIIRKENDVGETGYPEKIDYKVNTYKFKGKKDDYFKEFWLDEFEIDRLATKEEINVLQLKIDTKRYNL